MRADFHQQMLAEPLRTTIEYYASCWPESPKARAYVTRHALSAAASLQVGFADRSLGRQLPSKMTKAGRSVRARLETLGIYRGNGREHFRGYVTLPLHSTTGQVSGIHGRRVDRGTGPVEQSIGGGIFNAGALAAEGREIILTDNLLDAWTLFAAGYTQALCMVDCALRAEDLAQVGRIVVTSAGIDRGQFTGLAVQQLELPAGQTIHGYVKRHGPQCNTLARLLSLAGASRGQSDPASTRPDQPTDMAANNSAVDVVHLAAPEPRPDSEQAPAPAVTTPTSAAPSNTVPSDTVPSDAAPSNAVPSDAAPSNAVPAALACPLGDLQVQSSEAETTITIESRRWRIRGLQGNVAQGVMKVNVLVYHERTERFHVDSLDLYHARSRRSFAAEAADEIGADECQLRSDLGRVLLKLEQLQVEQKQSSLRNTERIQLSQSERGEALDLLRADNLLERILGDFEACGIVGERTAKLTGYLAATSRLLDRPLGLIIQSSTAAGKSSLIEAILSLMPEEQQLACSAMTGQSLYYAENLDLRHKIFSVAEEAGVGHAAYALKLLHSEGKLSLASTAKEAGTGRTAVRLHHVEGPVALLMSTTSLNVDPELLNRCIVVAVDESRSQTAAIHTQQRFNETLAGFAQKERSKKIVQLHRNAQRLLRALLVFNPYADQLSFIGWETRHRRDHGKYLTLIKAVTLLHQYQREIKQTTIDGQTIDYIEVTRRDIATANTIADWALGRSIDDLAEPTRRLLVELYDWLRQQAKTRKLDVAQIQFTRRAAREALNWRSTQLSYHLERLCRDEYVVRGGGRAGKLCQYQLLYDGRGREGQPCLLKLVDPQTLPESVNSAPTRGDLSA